MKNVIPLVTAVLLGLAAVFAVSKTVKNSEKPSERTRRVLIATSEIIAGEPIQESRVGVRDVVESALPRNAIDASEKTFAFNQKAKRTIAKGDYILYIDMDLDQSKSRALGDGQWGVPVSFADAALLRMLQPGDDIAIVGTFNYREPVKQGLWGVFEVFFDTFVICTLTALMFLTTYDVSTLTADRESAPPVITASQIPALISSRALIRARADEEQAVATV